MNVNLQANYSRSHLPGETYVEWLERSLMDSQVETWKARHPLRLANVNMNQQNELSNLRMRVLMLESQLEQARMRKLAEAVLFPDPKTATDVQSIEDRD